MKYKTLVRWFNGFGNFLARFCLLAMTGWAALAILYSNLPEFLRPWIAGIFGISGLFAVVGKYNNSKMRLGFFLLFTFVLGWWLLIPPSNDRNWQPDVAVLPWATIQGDSVAIHNIRNCNYRSETDYIVQHYDKTFDLTKLKSVDLFLTYWGSPYIAHTILSFGFEGEGNVCFSIETRMEIGEAYSNIKGFFKQYELTYVVADERDLIRLRTNYRHEQVYLYHLNASPNFIRNVFLDYLREVNSLKYHPEWYNSLTSNCTTSALVHTAPYDPNTILDWRYLVNGFVDEMLYNRKRIDTNLPFGELKKRSLINDRAINAGKSPEFSRIIRIGLPGM